MELIVNKQSLRIKDIASLKTGNVETYPIKLNFGEEYNNLAKVIVYITDKETINQDVVDENEVNIPAEALEHPTNDFFIGVFGYKVNEAGEIIEKRYSTNLVSIPVTNGSYQGKNPTPPSASVWERYISEMNKIFNATKNIKNETEIIKNETEAIRDETFGIKDDVVKLRDETEAIKNTAKDFVSSITYSTFEVTDDMELVIYNEESLGNMGFGIDDDTGVLEVEIS